MEVRETLFTKSFSVENDDPASLSLDFMRKLSDVGKIYEKKHVFETNGPVKKSVLVFDLVEVLDRFSRISINFSLESENRTLYVEILGEFVLKIKDYGFFTEIFTDFYLRNVFPTLRKVSEKRTAELQQRLEHF
jgi:hypothetical protein